MIMNFFSHSLPSLLLVLLDFLSFVEPHAYLKKPKSRNYEAHLAGYEYCPHCLNGGSKTIVMDNQLLNYGDQIFRWPPKDDTYEDSRHGICGDPAGPIYGTSADYSYHNFGKIDTEKIFAVGAEIDIEIFVKAHHEGHVELRLCNVKSNGIGCTLDYDCLQNNVLLRPSLAAANEVPGVDEFMFSTDNTWKTSLDTYTASGCGVKTQDSGGNPIIPVDECFPERVFLGNRNSPNKGVTKQGGNWLLQFKAKLPDGFTCTHCVLQMLYQSSNSCIPPGYRDETLPFTVHSNLAVCGEADNTYPEEFWNCADIAIGYTEDEVAAGSCNVGGDNYYGAQNVAGGGGGGGSCCDDCSCSNKNECNACSGCSYSSRTCNSI